MLHKTGAPLEQGAIPELRIHVYVKQMTKSPKSFNNKIGSQQENTKHQTRFRGQTLPSSGSSLYYITAECDTQYPSIAKNWISRTSKQVENTSHFSMITFLVITSSYYAQGIAVKRFAGKSHCGQELLFHTGTTANQPVRWPLCIATPIMDEGHTCSWMIRNTPWRRGSLTPETHWLFLWFPVVNQFYLKDFWLLDAWSFY